MSCNKACDGCAFTKGTEANEEANNFIKAMLCLLGPKPFYCHETVDWQDESLSENLPREKFKELNPGICQGWRREVKKLAETGYYKENPVITKVYGVMAWELLRDAVGTDNPEDKKILWQDFHRAFKALAKKFRKFGGHEICKLKP